MIKEFVKKIIYKEKYNSESYIKFLRSKGVKVGEKCYIYVPSKTLIDIQNPFMLEIGDNVKITEGVKILTHDFSWCVSSVIDGVVTGSVENVKIGNNVFIGMNAIILKGVTIEDNVIIGAGSIVTKNCERNSVYAGNPAKKIMSLEEYHEKQKEVQEKRLNNIIKCYKEKYNEFPNEKTLREFIFSYNSQNNDVNNIENEIIEDSGHYDKVKRAFRNNKSKYKNYNDLKERWK